MCPQRLKIWFQNSFWVLKAYYDPWGHKVPPIFFLRVIIWSQIKAKVFQQQNILIPKLVKFYYFWVADFESDIHFFLSLQNFAVLPDWRFPGRLLAFRFFSKILIFFHLKRKRNCQGFANKIHQNRTNGSGGIVFQNKKNHRKFATFFKFFFSFFSFL